MDHYSNINLFYLS